MHIWLFFLLAIPSLLYGEIVSETSNLPTLSQSRFVPLSSSLDALSEQLLWNADSHQLLWNLYINGHQALSNEELFQIPSSLFKFFDTSTLSYHTIQQELIQPDSKALQWLAYVTFLRELLARPPEKELSPLELSTVTQGLWAKVEGSQVTVVSSSKIWQRGAVLGPYLGRESAKKEFTKSKGTLDHFYALLRALRLFESFRNPTEGNAEYQHTLEQLRIRAFSRQTISEELQQHFPLPKRLEAAGSFFKLLPPSNGSGEWLSLNALLLDRYDPVSDQLVPLSNFTAYPNALFTALQKTYRVWITDPKNQEPSIWITHLEQGYTPLQTQSYLDTAQGPIRYPSFFRLKLEAFYVQAPLWPVVILLLLLSLLSSTRYQTLLFGAAFFGQTILLAIRCYLLERPPVTNMAESLLFVPWTACLLALLYWRWSRCRTPLYAASYLTIPLLSFAVLTGGATRLEQVQPVLNSQYWLTVHVLMVVSSYGAFLLAGMIAHLGLWKLYKKSSQSIWLERLTLQGMYVGTALLICGTLLGGVWAAQSWGRFWDWDPKEAWAFITSVLYLIWIHAYRFQLISTLGLYMGAVIGLQAVSFTWYGVNYILGTGLHSYGFGSGGELIYLGFLVLDTALTAFIAIKSATYKTEGAFSPILEKTT